MPGRSTGIPKMLRVMKENGSPTPEFDTDEDRTYFLIRLPVHANVKVPLEGEAAGEVTGEVTGEATGEVTGEVRRLLEVLEGEMQRHELQAALGLKHEDHFRKAYLIPALDAKLIEMTIPDKPRSSKQRYRRTTTPGPSRNQVTGEVTGGATGEVQRLLEVLEGEMQRYELQAALGLKHEDHFRKAYLVPALNAKLIEMTIPDKPRSSKQRYRLTTEPGPSRDQVTGEATDEVTGEVAGEVTGEVLQFLRVLAHGTLTRSDAQTGLGLKGQANFRDRYLQPAIEAGLVEMTIPDKPRSSKQKYRLTTAGQMVLAQLQEDDRTRQ